ncbi:MAG: GHKL domain-containing protein, partial [Actinobacteria bacterium]|nr:GHKL domain-containing protein [Actinomycetota bacterium]
ARLDTEAQRLQHLVTDLLDLSRLESASKTDKKTQTDLHAAVSTSFEAHRAEAQRKGLKFVFQDMTTTKSNCYANMDASDASLIIDNLLDNAIRYTEKGSVTVFLGIEDGMVVVRVSDTGIGIPLVDQSRIFERFYRVDTARSREAGGTGLGLSLVRHAVKRGGGTIEVRSELGVGSIFTISIPQAF